MKYYTLRVGYRKDAEILTVFLPDKPIVGETVRTVGKDYEVKRVIHQDNCNITTLMVEPLS